MITLQLYYKGQKVERFGGNYEMCKSIKKNNLYRFPQKLF